MDNTDNKIQGNSLDAVKYFYLYNRLVLREAVEKDFHEAQKALLEKEDLGEERIIALSPTERNDLFLQALKISPTKSPRPLNVYATFLKKELPGFTHYIITHGGDSEIAYKLYKKALSIYQEKLLNNSLVLTVKVETYIFSIGKNLWRNEYKRLKRDNYKNRVKLEGDFEHADIDEKSILDDYYPSEYDTIWDFIESVSSNCNTLAKLHFKDGLDWDMVAKKLQHGSGESVRQQFSTCKKKIRIKLIKHGLLNARI